MTRVLAAGIVQKRVAKKRGRSGFTLVEVALALGIMGFGLVTMLALMPVGLGSLRESREEVQRGQIVQQTISRAMLTPFSKLAQDFIGGGPYYFDAQGGLQKEQDGSTSFVVTPKEVSLASPDICLYPGADQVTNLQSNMFVVELEIQAVKGPGKISKYVAHIPNQGN